MSRFEAFVWSWYTKNVTPLVFESGLMGRLIDRLGLDEVGERLFLRGLNEIRQFILKVQAAEARR